MINSSIGNLFRVSTFGESHGPALGVVIDGCPAGLTVDLDLLRTDLDRRKPGQSKFVTPRKEDEEFEILSGVFEGVTTGTPIAVIIRNKDARSKDYKEIKDLFRPGHADFTYFAKYRHRDYRGGGRSSARETAARVIAGCLAKQLLGEVKIRAAVVQIEDVKAESRVWSEVEDNPFRFADPSKLDQVEERIERARKERDSVGGIVEVEAVGVPPGWGEPIFARLDAMIAAAMMSIPAVKGVEIGLGFQSAEHRGSRVNDEFSPQGFLSNNHGGVLGGISSGAPVVCRMAIKPTSSIAQDLQTIDTNFKPAKIATKGRHDPCVALRAVPIAEAMMALVLVDFWLQDLSRREARKGFSPIEPLKYDLK